MVIVCREIAVTGMRGVAADKGVVIAADRYGKMKTIAQSFKSCAALATIPFLDLTHTPGHVYSVYSPCTYGFFRRELSVQFL